MWLLNKFEHERQNMWLLGESKHECLIMNLENTPSTLRLSDQGRTSVLLWTYECLIMDLHENIWV